MQIEEFESTFLALGKPESLTNKDWYNDGHQRFSRTATVFALAVIARTNQAGFRLIAGAITAATKTIVAALTNQPIPIDDAAARLAELRKRLEAEAAAKAKADVEAALIAAAEQESGG